MEQWSRKIFASIAALAVVPIGVEFLISYIKGESYSMARAGAVLTGVIVVLCLLILLRIAVRRMLLAVQLTLLVLGLGGTLVSAIALATRSANTTDSFGITATVLCLLISALAGYAIYIDQSGVEIFMASTEAPAVQVTEQFNDSSHRVLLTKFPSFEPCDEELITLCRASVDTGDIHFIGYFANGKCRFHVDVLDDQLLNRFFRQLSRGERRFAYERAGRQLNWTMQRINTYLRRLGGGILIRTVLDVEQGALYYCWIDKNVYLVGVTMDQSKVLRADEKLRRLANCIGLLPRGGTYELPAQPIIEQVEAPENPAS
jgi:hypothetical protein